MVTAALDNFSLKDQADALLRGQQHHEAVAGYVRAILSDPGNADLLSFNLALARHRWRSGRIGQPLRVAVCGWELSHNAAGRVRALADIWRAVAETEIIGATFANWGDSLWPPIAGTDTPCHTIHVTDDHQFLRQALDLVLAHPYDTVHLSKPRMPNILFGLLYKLVWDAQIILDIDDEELGVVRTDTTLTLDALKEQNGGKIDLSRLAHGDWTRVAVGQAGIFDGITVSNPALQSRYGGFVLPHARPAGWFDKDRRAQLRAKHGIDPDKKVVLFFGTPRKHKGLLETAQAIASLGREDLCYLIVGDFPDPKAKEALQAIGGVDLRFLPGQPYDKIPEIAALGDICVLLQSDTSLLARFQVPAKLVDALGAGQLVLAQPTAGMMDFVRRGVVVPTTAELLAQTLASLLDDEAEVARIRAKGQAWFRSHLSVEACAPRLASLPDNWRPRPHPQRLLENPAQKDLFAALGGWQMFRAPSGPAPTRGDTAPDRQPAPLANAAGQGTAPVARPAASDVVVYTVLVGDYEAVKEPEVIDPSVRYILFTDNPALKSERWEVRQFDTLGLSPRRASRLPKLLPHHYLPEHEVSVYLDASLTIIEPDVSRAAAEALQDLDIAAYSHFERNCVFDEIDACLALGKADPERSEAFRARLLKEKFPKGWGLLENAFLVRRNTPVMRLINELWFKEYMAGPERDQFSLMYVLWRAEIAHATIANAPGFRKSPHLRWTKHHGATACGGHPDMKALAAHFDFLARTEPRALFETAMAAIEKMGKIRTAEGAAAVSTRLMRQAIEAVTGLELQGCEEAQACRNALSRTLFPKAAAFMARRGTKLAYIPNSAMPSDAANNVHVMKMCSAFKETGTDVTLYSEQNPSYDGKEDLQKRFDTRAAFPLVLVEKDERGRENLLYRLVQRAIHDGCTHIYTRSLEAAVYAAAADVPVIFEEHKLEAEDKSAYLSFLARSPALEKIVVISKPLRARMAPVWRGLEDKTVVLHDGADPVTDRPASFELQSVHASVANVGYVGHLYPGKGAELCLELARLMPHVTFHMLGGNAADVAEWKDKSRHLCNLVFYGHRPHVEVPAFIGSVDICIAPFLRNVGVSGGKYNVADFFSPLKIFEYMAHAKPIVTSDLPVLREVLTDGETALMCDPDRPESFVAALQHLISDPATGAKLGRAAQSHFEAHFTWRGRAREIRALLDAARPQIDPPPPSVPRSMADSAAQTKPLMRWYYGGEKQEGWAYGINARRLSARIPSCDHIAPGALRHADRPLDIALAFDILIMIGEKFQSGGAKRKILRVGGPNPLKVFCGGNLSLLKDTISQADSVIALSPQLRDYLAALHPSVHFIPNGIDIDAIKPSLRRRESGRSFTVGMSASMSKEVQRHTKGYYFATEACEKAGVKLLMVGRGINQIPHDKLVDEFWSKIDVLLHPVGAGKEASSNVIMEAMALGVPVITTRHAGFHGVALEHGTEGLLMRRTVGDFVEAILALQGDAELCERLADRGRAFVERHHALGVVARAYEEVIWSSLSSPVACQQTR